MKKLFPRSIICALCITSITSGLLSGCSVRRTNDNTSTGTMTESAKIQTSAEVTTSTKDITSTEAITSAEVQTEATTFTDTTESTTVPESTPTPAETTSTVTTNQTDTTANKEPSITAGKSSTGMTIEVIDGVTYVGGVLVANKTYALPESYYIGGLTDDTYAAFVAMQSAAAADGLTLFCKSGFRSYIDQRIIYNGYVDRDGQALADTYSARPGHSEHQSGMALDINSTASAFADTSEGKWLAEHCWDYGFIIRYPADKVDITGYMYEPWHVRYVGKEIAAELKNSGLCLEEYLGITSKYAE